MPKKPKKKTKKDVAAVVLNPQQQEFLSYYLNVDSETFGNALQSALKAKYSQEYAESITAQMPRWLSENLGDVELLNQATENIKNFLKMDVKEPIIGMFGPAINPETKKPYEKDNVNKMKLKVDVSKFVAETIGKKRFSKASGGAAPVVPVQINFNNIRDEFKAD